MTRKRWYDDPDSACPVCGHGPRWHNDPNGCTRMNGGWCPCERRYGALSQGPDDYVGRDGAYYEWTFVDDHPVSRAQADDIIDDLVDLDRPDHDDRLWTDAGGYNE